MPFHPPTDAPARRQPPCGEVGVSRSHDRGFILLIVLGILILVTILSVAYLRTMRQRGEGVARAPGNNIGQAADSVVALALDAIASDMPLRNSGQEDFDFPWTDASATLMPATLSYPVRQSGLFTKGNPARDDAWLASSYPDDGSHWGHLTNLTGSFLNVTTSALDATGGVPSDVLSNNMESNVGITDGRLVDADGDGIGDSFFFYPPKSLIGNVRYVAAAYIEDLSAKINLNTALPLRTKVGGNYNYAAVLPKAWTPSDVDLAALSSVFGATSAEIASAVQWRALNDATAQPWADGKRRLYWGNRASKSSLSGESVAGDANRYTAADEIELRFHGGINDHRATNGTSGTAVPVMTPVESAGTGLPTLLRATNTAAITENTYSDTPFNSPASYLRNNPRRWVTTMNGDAARQVGLDGVFLGEELRYNLNIQNPAHFAATVGDTVTAAFFRGPDGVGGTADDYPMPAGFQRFVPTAAERPSAMANQWLANLTDARDKDNIVTRIPDGAGWWYGFEPLPLLSEVYMQRGYYKNAVSGGGPYTLTCCASNTGAASGGDAASYAFELVNPYAFPIKLTNVDLAVQLPGSGVAGGPYAISTDLTAAAWSDRDNDGDPVLLPGHRLILWRNGSTADARNDLTTMVNNAVALDGARNHKITCGLVLSDVAVASMPAGGDGSTGTGFARVDLLCYSELRDGTGIQREPGAYSTITVPWLPNTFKEATADATVTGVAVNGLLGFRQVDGRAFGTDQGLNLLQCRPARWPNLALPNLTQSSPAAALTNVAVAGAANDLGDTAILFTRVRNAAAPYKADTTYQKLGNATKAALPAGRADLRLENLWFNQQTLAGQPRVSGDQFTSLMDLLRVPMMGMRGTSATHRGPLTLQANGQYVETGIALSLYEFLESGAKPLSSACVTIDPGSQSYSSNVATTSHKNVPFSWLLPCLYDTLNPASDGGLDLNSDGSVEWFDQGGTGKGLNANWPDGVDLGSYLIPGRLNLNTAPQHVLAETLPIPNAALRADLAAKIVARRNGAPASGTRAATDRGLSSVFEVLQDAPSMAGFAGSATSRYDLVENLGCLPSVATCRSDFFAVHILVQGYKATNFSSGALEQKRILVLVNRATLTTPNKAQLKYWVYNY